MIYVHNTTDNAYLMIAEYLQELEAESTDSYRVIFALSIADLFILARKRTAVRGRFSKDEEGNSLLDKLALTFDEEDLFDDWLKTTGAEVFRCLSGWAKGIDYAYRHDANFGVPSLSGSVDEVSGTIVTDESLALTTNELIGKKLVITSPGLYSNQERTITGNTATTITLLSAFDSDITGLDFMICDATAKYIVYYINADEYFDPNMLQGIENSIQESLVTYIIKEWYKANRFMDDYTIEEAHYQESLSNISSQLFQTKKPIRRPTDWFEL